MSAILAPALIGGITGLGTGALASIVSPWANWGVEQRRERQVERRRLVADWRDGINEFYKDRAVGGVTVVVPETDLRELFASDWYQGLRLYAAPEKRQEWEKRQPRPDGAPLGGGDPALLLIGVAVHTRKLDMLAEVHRIESDWKLV